MIRLQVDKDAVSSYFYKNKHLVQLLMSGVVGTLLIAVLTGCQSLNGHPRSGAGPVTSSALPNKPGFKSERFVNQKKCIACRAPSASDLLMAGIKQAERVDKLKPIPSHPGIGIEGMTFIKGGAFNMGSNDFEDSRPIHKVIVGSFLMDTHEVTNAEFEIFVEATGYITVSERSLDPKDYPGVPRDELVAGSAVFKPPVYSVSLDDIRGWWKYVGGANWRHPEGPGSSIKGKGNYPVVQICYSDGAAYANWAGKRLPTEAEWEYAARAGKSNKHYYWGNELKPQSKWMANLFQGKFPYQNLAEDGFKGLAPVGSFPANAFHLYDMEGNVWEWCSDLYRADYYRSAQENNPQGPTGSYDAQAPGTVEHVQKGGSFLCSEIYCSRYVAGSRGKGEQNSASNNLGFRCVRDVGSIADGK